MKQALIASLGFCLFFSLQIILQKKLLITHISPIQMNFLMSLTSFVLLSIYGLFFNKKIFQFRLIKPVFKPYLVATVLWITADLLAIYGLKMSNSVNYSILSRTTVFFTYFLAILFFKEKFYFNKVVSVFLSFIGSFLIVYNFKNSVVINYGDLFFIGFSLFVSLSGLFRPKVLIKITAIHLTFIIFFLSAIILGLLTVLLDPFRNFIIPIPIIFISIFGLLGFNLVNFAIQKAGAPFFSVISSLLPFFTAILAYFFLKTLPSVNQIFGGLIIILSIYLFQKKHENN